ncbi:MAG: hypothetical protein SGILL_008143 [Bacillariaceae sp.]
MSTADRAYEVFMRWYLDERMHQVIADFYQMREVVIAAREFQRSCHDQYPEHFKEVASRLPHRVFDWNSNDGWTDFGREEAAACEKHIIVFNDLLVDKKQLPVPLIRIKPEMGDEEGDEDFRIRFPKEPNLDARALVFQLLKDLENRDLESSLNKTP